MSWLWIFFREKLFQFIMEVWFVFHCAGRLSDRMMRYLTGDKFYTTNDIWSIPHSLYASLGIRHCFFIECTIRSGYIGHSHIMEPIFRLMLPANSSYPIVALAKATANGLVGDYHDAVECLEEILWKIDTGEFSVPKSLHFLLKMHHAAYKYESHGTLRSSLETARSLRSWLVNVDLQDYTDGLVPKWPFLISSQIIQCVNLYHDIIKSCRIYSNWLQEDDGDLPPTSEKTATASLTRLRRYLQQQKRFRECVYLVKTETSIYEGDAKLMPYEEFFSEEWPFLRSEFAFCRLFFIRIFYAFDLFTLGHRKRAEAELEASADLATSFTKKPLKDVSPRLSLLYDMVEASVKHPHRLNDRVQIHALLADKARELQDRPMERWQRHLAVDLAKQLANSCEVGIDRIMAYQVKKKEMLKMLTFASEVGHLPLISALVLTSLIPATSESYISEAELTQYFEDFQARFPDFDVPFTSQRLHSEAISAYRQLHNVEKVHRYLEKFESAVTNCPGIVTLENGELRATTQNAERLLCRLAMHHGLDIQRATKIYQTNMIILWLRRDLQSGDLSISTARRICKDESLQVSSLDQIVTETLRDRIFGLEKPVERRDWEPWFFELSAWLMRDVVPSSDEAQHDFLVEVLQCRIRSLRQYCTEALMNTPTEVRLENQRQTAEVQKQLQQIEAKLDRREFGDRQRRDLEHDIAMTEELIYWLVTKPETMKDDDLIKFQSKREEHLIYLRESQKLQSLWLALQPVARLAFTRWANFQSVSIFSVLAYIEEADEIFHRLSGQGFILQAIEKVSASMEASETMEVSQLYDMGISYSLVAWTQWLQQNKSWIVANPQSPVPEYMDKVCQEFVKWTQKSKARAIALGMGGGSRAIQLLWDSIGVSDNAKELLGRCHQIADDTAQDSSFSRNILAFEELESLWTQMEEDVSAATVLGMSRGRSMTSAGFLSLCRNFDEQVVFVDWFVLEGLPGVGDIGMAVYRNGQLQNILTAGMAYADVESWISRNLDPDPYEDEEGAAAFVPLTGRRDTEVLLKMQNLLKAVDLFVKPGELLVFCPTRALSRIPLHALPFPGQDEPCICRNPIVYCQSLTLLRLCIYDRLATVDEEDTAGRRPVVFDAIGGSHGDGDGTNEPLNELASTLGGQLTSLESGDAKQEFIDKASEASIIHFHGHVAFDESKPMEHHLELRNAQWDESGDMIPLKENERLTAKDVFGFRFRPGTHITTISCKSARTTVSKVNDHIGLASAFHCAGAPSMVSSLWNIEGPTGMKFSRLFYDHLRSQRQTPRYFKRDDGERVEASAYVDMARAMQHAVVTLRRSSSSSSSSAEEGGGKVLAPAEWAGLVLNGNWTLPLVWMQPEVQQQQQTVKAEDIKEPIPGIARQSTFPRTRLG